MFDNIEHEDYLKKKIREITRYNISKDEFLKILKELSGTEKLILSLELGINNGSPKTRKEVANIFRASEIEIQQKEEKAYQKVRTIVAERRR